MNLSGFTPGPQFYDRLSPCLPFVGRCLYPCGKTKQPGKRQNEVLHKFFCFFSSKKRRRCGFKVEEKQISQTQLCALLWAGLMAPAAELLPAATLPIAGRGAWLSALVFIGLMAMVEGLMVWALTVDPVPLPVALLLAGWPLVFVAGALLALRQRLKEIRKGEEDAYRNY